MSPALHFDLPPSDKASASSSSLGSRLAGLHRHRSGSTSSKPASIRTVGRPSSKSNPTGMLNKVRKILRKSKSQTELGVEPDNEVPYPVTEIQKAIQTSEDGRMRIFPVTYADETLIPAAAAMKVITDCGYRCCLCGEAAWLAYGSMRRHPTTIEILVWSPTDRSTRVKIEEIEYLENSIVQSGNNFFLQPKKRSPSVPHPQLCYSLIPGKDDIGTSRKINIVSKHEFSSFPDAKLVTSRPHNIPLMPYFALILQKLNSWTAHNRDPQHRGKALKERDEILDMLRIFEYYKLKAQGNVNDWTDYEDDFVKKAKQSVREFLSHNQSVPEVQRLWERLGIK